MNSELFVGLCPTRFTKYDTAVEGSIVHHNSGLQYTLSGDSVAWIIIQVDTGTWSLDTGHQDQLSKDMINSEAAPSSPPH